VVRNEKFLKTGPIGKTRKLWEDIFQMDTLQEYENGEEEQKVCLLRWQGIEGAIN
jgi:hypothetical protein